MKRAYNLAQSVVRITSINLKRAKFTNIIRSFMKILNKRGPKTDPPVQVRIDERA